MANYTIQRREGKGGIRYRSIVRWYEGKKEKSKSKTFSRNSIAEAWGKKEIEKLESTAVHGAVSTLTVGGLIREYLNDDFIKIGRSKEYSLNLICDCDIASIRAVELEAHHVVDFCKDRSGSGAGPVTVNIDVSNLRGVLKVARPVWGYPVTDKAVSDAMPTLHTLKLVGKSNRRSRRPVDDELERLAVALGRRQSHPNSNAPFTDMLEFSILSCMRVGEVCKILWDDFEEEDKAVLVRDRKDPRKKEGNHMLVPLLGGAFEIVMRQPRTGERIFPHNSTSVSAAFQRERDKLGIKDLRYHDLRREGASRLFERGYHVDQVAQVTGHRDLNTLWQIYTELFPKRLHDLEDAR